MMRQFVLIFLHMTHLSHFLQLLIYSKQKKVWCNDANMACIITVLKLHFMVYEILFDFVNIKQFCTYVCYFNTGVGFKISIQNS